MEQTKTITIFNMKLSAYLILKGFILLGMGKNNNDIKKNVFFFKDTPELQEGISHFNLNKHNILLNIN